MRCDSPKKHGDFGITRDATRCNSRLNYKIKR